MGFLARLLGQPKPKPVTSRDSPTLTLTLGVRATGPMRVAGTTTFRRADANTIARVLLERYDGYLETYAVLHLSGPSGGSKTTGVNVLFGDTCIGALSTKWFPDTNLEEQLPKQVDLQLFAADTPKGPRLDAWVWLAGGVPAWEYDRAHRPPVTTEERSKEAQQATQQTVSQALRDGGHRAAQFDAGRVNGMHFLETVEPIKQLKREGRLEEALELCYIGIAGAEKDSKGLDPAPWYTMQAAIIHRKLKQHTEEIAVLERYLAACPLDHREHTQAYERWVKLTGQR